jgi:DNA-binding NtrC family response regulator
MGDPETRATQADDSHPADGGSEDETREPGVVMIFSDSKPCCVPVALGAPIELGRGQGALPSLLDPTLSRRHARVAWEGGRFHLTDLGSRNGSAVDGERLEGTLITDTARVLRLGHSVFLLCRDVRPFARLGVQTRDDRVEGPATQRVLLSVARVGPLSRTLFIGGESGSGKEGVARAFHRAGPASGGAFVAVNCAAIPEGIAERLLFGALRGAYSGATADTEGYLQASSGGTLFLDEVADLDASVQGKLLRVIESGEVTPLGATRPRKVDLRVCSATCKDLRALASSGGFRPDLYFRLGVPQVSVPPLRERREEIPWLVARAVHRVDPGLAPHATLVEACLARAWPGNVRELLAELHTAAITAMTAGSPTVGAQHLSPSAGSALNAASAAPTPAPAAPPDRAQDEAARERARLSAALEQNGGNVSATARALGLHRTQLRRLLARHGIDAGR